MESSNCCRALIFLADAYPKGHCKRPTVPNDVASTDVMFTDQVMELHLDYAAKRTKYHCLSQRLPHQVAGACATKDEETKIIYMMGGRNATRYAHKLLHLCAFTFEKKIMPHFYTKACHKSTAIVAALQLICDMP